jgi:non-specific serine/threonine protein kinase/serine/threonine-protein kinase
VQIYDSARVESLFHAAADLPESEREPFLERECAGDSELLELVRSLLIADQAIYPLSSPVKSGIVSSLTAVDSTPLEPGARLGAYRVIRELGRGGMGTVFLAGRADGQYERLVAIKVISAGGGDPTLAERFQRERQILARLDHPAIARLIDGGVTSDQRPYLVMEYVDGEPITVFCERRQLNVRQRLELFLLVCAAVRAAHRNLIVHRDIKPSNILVTAAGEPKLLDFGIAKILSDEQDHQHSKTLIAFTPDYASPEQVRGEFVSTPTDVYQIGTLLFELLSGQRPFGSSGGSSYEILMAVTQNDPPRPSSVATRETDRRAIRGDLDRIILHALEKDPVQRYSSADALAADIQRHLDGFPVLARGVSIGYRAGKFVRRNSKWVIAAVTAAILAMAGFVQIVRSERIANAQRAKAERRFQEVRELANSYVFEMDASLSAIPGTTKVRAGMNRRVLKYLDRLSAEASGDLGLERELAAAYTKLAVVQGVSMYANIGDPANALKSIEKAIELRKAVLSGSGSNPADEFALAAATLIRGHVRLGIGDLDGALQAHQDALQRCEALLARTPRPSGKLLNVTVSALEAVAGDFGGNGAGVHTGDPGAALPLLDRAMELTIREGEVRAHEPDSGRLNSYRYSNQAVVELLRGRLLAMELRRPLDESTIHFQNAMQLLTTTGSNLNDAEIKRKLLVTQIWWAAALLDERKPEPARTLLERCRELSSDLLRIDPDNRAAILDDCLVEILDSEAEALAGTGSAWTRIQKVIDAERAMLENGSDDAAVESALTSEELRAAKVALARGRFELAQRWFTDVTRMAELRILAHPTDGKTRMDLAAARIGLARIYETERKAADAKRLRGLAASAAQQVVERHSGNPRAQALLMEATARAKGNP